MDEGWTIVLSVLESPDQALIGAQKVFTASPIRIGRAEDSDFVIGDPTVSRSHATLRVAGDVFRVFITDTSTHGTVVSGRKVPPGLGSGFTVHDGDTIQVGNTVIRIETNVKQSLQATMIGTADQVFLGTADPKEPDGEHLAGEESPEPLPARSRDQKGQFSSVSIAIIIICLILLAYLILFT